MCCINSLSSRRVSADGRLLVKAGAGSMPVVLMEPWFEMLAPLLGVLVGPGLHPFFDCSLDEAFAFPLVRGV